MSRKADGSFKVPSELVDAWASGDQDALVTEFIDSGLDKDTWDMWGIVLRSFYYKEYLI